MILKIFRIKHIYHLHNKGVKDASTNKLNNVLYHFVFKNTDVILLSEYLYPDVQQYVLKNRILICPNGIPSKILPPKNKSQKKDGIVKILFLSNLIESKGVFVLLEAMGILKHKDVLFEGLFVGGEGDISEIQFQQRVNQLNIQEQVHYLGKKYGTDKEKIFNEADIFAFPTYYSKETFGIVNLEAMQHELPIVSTPEGGIPDIVHNGINGFLVPPKDSVQLAEKLEKLILNRDLRIKMGKAGKKIYEENYTANIFEKRLLQVLLKQIQTD